MSRSSSAWRSLTPPGSYSIVVTATVAPTANTVTRPRSTELAATIRSTPSVRSTMCPWPGVWSRSMPPHTPMPLPDLDPGEAPLAELQDAPVELGGGQVERPGGHGLAVDPHPALGQAAPSLGCRDPERAGQQGREVHDLAVGRVGDGVDLVRSLMADVDPVEVLLGGGGGLRTVEALHQRPSERPFGIPGRQPGVRRPAEQEPVPRG